MVLARVTRPIRWTITGVGWPTNRVITRPGLRAGWVIQMAVCANGIRNLGGCVTQRMCYPDGWVVHRMSDRWVIPFESLS